jgi:hypothetical protein
MNVQNIYNKLVDCVNNAMLLETKWNEFYKSLSPENKLRYSIYPHDFYSFTHFNQLFSAFENKPPFLEVFNHVNAQNNERYLPYLLSYYQDNSDSIKFVMESYLNEESVLNGLLNIEKEVEFIGDRDERNKSAL